MPTCRDYRSLNAQTISSRYTISLIQYFGHYLANYRLFPTLDPAKAYHPIAVAERYSKDSNCTPFGPFEFTWMAFVMCNAVQTLHRFIHPVLGSLDFLIVYLDDILVGPSTESKDSRISSALFIACLPMAEFLTMKIANFSCSRRNPYAIPLSQSAYNPAHTRWKRLRVFAAKHSRRS